MSTTGSGGRRAEIGLSAKVVRSPRDTRRARRIGGRRAPGRDLSQAAGRDFGSAITISHAWRDGACVRPDGRRRFSADARSREAQGP